MNERQLKILGGVLVAAVILLAGLRTLGRQARTPQRLWDAADPAAATGLTLAAPGADPLVFAKKDGVWALEKPRAHAADSARLERLLGTFADARLSPPLTERAKHHERFELDARHAVVARVTGGKKPLELFVGKPAEGGGVFVRRADAPHVFTVMNLRRGDVLGKLDQWLDMTLIQPDPAKVTAVRVAKGAKTLELTRDKDGWLMSGKRVDEQKTSTVIEPMLSTLKRFAADEWIFEPQGVKTGLDEPSMRVDVTLEDGSSVGVEFGAAEDGMHFVRAKGGANVYQLRDWKLETVSRLFEL